MKAPGTTENRSVGGSIPPLGTKFPNENNDLAAGSIGPLGALQSPFAHYSRMGWASGAMRNRWILIGASAGSSSGIIV